MPMLPISGSHAKAFRQFLDFADPTASIDALRALRNDGQTGGVIARDIRDVSAPRGEFLEHLGARWRPRCRTYLSSISLLSVFAALGRRHPAANVALARSTDGELTRLDFRRHSGAGRDVTAVTDFDRRDEG